jgi:hypothetical protein
MKSSEKMLPIARVSGKLRAVGWNAVGLSAVVDHSLVAWGAGAKDLHILSSIASLERAKDVLLIGESRAVVILDSLTALITGSGQLVIAGLTGSGRYSNDALFLLDRRSGTIWKVTGLEQIGVKAADDEYAKKLIASAKGEDPSQSEKFLEAARILGCDAAMRLVTAP